MKHERTSLIIILIPIIVINYYPIIVINHYPIMLLIIILLCY
jgi:hypothetical protein